MAIGTPAAVGTGNGGGAGIAITASAVGTTHVFTVGAAGVPAGDYVRLVGTSASSNEISGVVDSKSNTYTLRGDATSPGGVRQTRAYLSELSTPLVNGDTITATFISSTGVKASTCESVTGLPAGAYSSSSATQGSSTTPTISTAALPHANCLIWVWSEVDAPLDYSHTADSEFTQQLTANSSDTIVRTAYAIPGSAAAITYNPTISVSHPWGIGYIVLAGTAPAGASGGGSELLLSGVG